MYTNWMEMDGLLDMSDPATGAMRLALTRDGQGFLLSRKTCYKMQRPSNKHIQL